MAREIIIGDDESSGGDDALALGRLLAGAFDADPVVVSVLEFPNTLATLLDLEEYLAVTSESVRKRVAERLGREAEVRTFVSESPAHVISEAAEEDAALALVLGSTERGSIGRIYPGSTAVALLQGGPSAVAIAPRGYAEQPPGSIGRIAVALDGSDEAQAALKAGAVLARRLGAGLRVLTVVQPVPNGWTPQAGPTSLDAYIRFEQEAKEKLLSAALEEAGAGVEAEGRLLEGDVVNELAAASADSDLLLVGSRGYGPLRRALLGTVTSRLARSASCPLLMFPRGAGADPLRFEDLDE